MARLRGSKRFDLVVDLARRKREEADQVLQASRQRLEQAENGLQQLLQFLDQYIEETRLSQGQTLTSIQLQMPSAFVNRLRGSIDQQRQVVSEYQTQHQQIEAWWRKLFAREKAIIKLQKKMRTQESIAAEKQLQKQIDELWQNRPTNFI